MNHKFAIQIVIYFEGKLKHFCGIRSNVHMSKLIKFLHLDKASLNRKGCAMCFFKHCPLKGENT